MSHTVRGRFAPTPSGRMHLGNLFSALIAWLSVRQQNGIMLLRIEDLDRARCKREYAEQLIKDLALFGLDYDEGGLTGTDRFSESCVQSERNDYYHEVLSILSKRAHIYPCFCTRAQLHDINAPHLGDYTPVYAGTCRNLSSAEILQKQTIRNPSLRIEVPNQTIAFNDCCQGHVEENLSHSCGDFVLQRADGIVSYQLAVVADDARMGVTEVVRGRDLLFSTARQLFLYDLLDAVPPRFAHVPLLLAPDHRRLSKRDAALSLTSLLTRFSPEELIGILAALCGLIDRPEPVKAVDLIPHFSFEQLKKEDIVLSPSFYHV